MGARIERVSISKDVYDLRKQRGRFGSAFAGATTPRWVPSNGVSPDVFAIAGPTDTVHTLTNRPLGINGVYLNGLLMREGTDYTLDYTTGVITVAAAVVAGDELIAHYVTTGRLTAAAIPPEQLGAFRVDMYSEFALDNFTAYDTDGTTVLFTDAFNRANGAVGNGWTTAPNVAISSNEVITTVTGPQSISRDLGALATADFEFDVLLPAGETVGHGLFCQVGEQVGGDLYFFALDLMSFAPTIRLQFCTGATFSTPTVVGTSGTLSTSRAATWRFTFDGTTYTAKRNGVIELTGAL